MDTDYELVCHCDDDGWLEQRKTGIGASEIASVLGVGFQSALELYGQKTGEIPPKDLSDNEAVFWGSKLEALIGDVYHERTKRIVIKSGSLYRSLKYEWALCTLDAITQQHDDGGDQVHWPLEIKTTSARFADAWSEGPPEMYLLQVHQQMLVTGAQRATIACLIGGQRLVWTDVERDETTINRIIKAGSDFWRRVQKQDPPLPDGSQGAGKALEALYPKATGTSVQLDAEFLDIDASLATLKAIAKETGTKIKQREQRIKAQIGNAACGILPNGTVYTWGRVDVPAQERKAYSFRKLTRKKGKP